MLGNLYQKYIDKDERKRLGQFYTPDEVVQYILDSVGYTSDAEIENKKLLDPAFGSGGFLVPATNRLINRLKSKIYDPITILHKVRENIYGFDINPFAAHLTETNLLFQVAYLISGEKKLDADFRVEQFNVFVTDSLRIPEAGQIGKNMPLFENDLLNSAAVHDAEIVKEIKLKQGRFEGGMDFVVGNPSWGGILKKEKETILSQELKNNYVSAVGKYDIYVLFIEAGIHWLNDQGILGLHRSE
ncbi:MAG: N-6 DNA methylase [bacterium]|nr:MAG: N-6 DNA methylase [bacterium]